MTESFVHVAMRQFLKREGWKLVAGEFPGGSDDELYVFSVMNPELACDNSPSPRKHSEGEIIPDLLAYKDGIMLIIEAKPKYSYNDKNKLKSLLYDKSELLKNCLSKFCKKRHIDLGVSIECVVFVPTLAFGNPKLKIYEEEPGFAHLYVKSLEEAQLVFF